MAQGGKASLKIKVTDFDGVALSGEKILFVGQKKGAEVNAISDDTGSGTVLLEGGDIYDIQIKSVGEAEDYSTIEIPSIGENEQFGEALLTIMIEEAKSFTLNNVHFNTGSAELKTSSEQELKELVEYLNRKKEVQVEIGGHTDNVGEEEANKKLSQKRAEAVKQYLIKNGVSASRLKAVGYGETRPVADNSSDKGRALNRRTEVKIL